MATALGRANKGKKRAKPNTHKAALRNIGSIPIAEAAKKLLKMAEDGDLKAAEIIFGYLGKTIGKPGGSADGGLPSEEAIQPIGFTAKTVPGYNP